MTSLTAFLNRNVGHPTRPCLYTRCTARPVDGLIRRNPAAENAGAGRPRSYCSDDCRTAAQNKRRTLRTALKKLDDSTVDPAMPTSLRNHWRDAIAWELAALDNK